MTRLRRSEFNSGQKLYRRAKKLIPGGTQLLSKRPELTLPELWPAYASRARGAVVWDLDGRRYTDMSYMGIGACILGYAHPDVDRAVSRAIAAGSMTTLNCAEEVELAHELIRIHPWAGMARFARCGGEAMSVAVRIARAHRQKDKILFCGYHGWHDWYLAANLAKNRALDGHLIPGLAPRGVPRALRGTAFTFKYNDLSGFLTAFRRHQSSLAAVVMEPIRGTQPEAGFLERVRAETRRARVPLIFDEVSAGWRLTHGGAHKLFGIDPDLAVFAKGISNGYPMAAVIGRTGIMQAAQDSFISSTYWTERVGPAAALATLKVLREKKAAERLVRAGQTVQNGWKTAAEKTGIPITVSGMPPISHFGFRNPEPLVLKTLFVQEMLAQGFLATDAFYASLAHTDRDIERYLAAVEKTFGLIRLALDRGDVRRRLKGPVCHGGFKRLA